MATVTSVVGAWNLFTDWNCDGKLSPDMNDTPIIFQEGGGVKGGGGFGNWIQVEGMVVWSFWPLHPIGLYYTANVTRDALIGIMGFVNWRGSGGQGGCFYATRADAGATSSAASGATPEEVEKASIFGPEHKA